MPYSHRVRERRCLSTTPHRATIPKRGAALQAGIALLAAILVLASIATLAAATLLITQLQLKIVQNRAGHVQAWAEAYSRMTTALLLLEAGASTGALPHAAPPVAGVIEYDRQDDFNARLVIEAEAQGGTAKHRTEARVRLQSLGGAARAGEVNGGSRGIGFEPASGPGGSRDTSGAQAATYASAASGPWVLVVLDRR